MKCWMCKSETQDIGRHHICPSCGLDWWEVNCLCGYGGMAKSHDYNLEGYDDVWTCPRSPRCQILCYQKGDILDYRIGYCDTMKYNKGLLMIWDEVAL
jgi:hypothetical protein